MAGTAARHEPCRAWWPEPYLHVELGPRGGGLHHPVHHSDEGLALAHLRHTGKERAEVSGGRAPVLPVNWSRSPQDAKCHLLRWPRGSSCGPALLLFRSVPSGRFFGGKTRIKWSQLGADGTDRHELGQGRQQRGPAHRRTHGRALALPHGSVPRWGWRGPAGELWVLGR